MIHLHPIVLQIVRLPERVLTLADSRVGVLHQDHDLLEYKRVPVLHLLILVRLDVNVAVQQQPSVLLQVITVRQVEVYDALLDLLDDYQVLGIPLHFIRVLGHVVHSLLGPLQPAVVLMGRRRLIHKFLK